MVQQRMQKEISLSNNSTKEKDNKINDEEFWSDEDDFTIKPNPLVQQTKQTSQQKRIQQRMQKEISLSNNSTKEKDNKTNDEEFWSDEDDFTIKPNPLVRQIKQTSQQKRVQKETSLTNNSQVRSDENKFEIKPNPLVKQTKQTL